MDGPISSMNQEKEVGRGFTLYILRLQSLSHHQSLTESSSKWASLICPVSNTCLQELPPMLSSTSPGSSTHQLFKHRHTKDQIDLLCNDIQKGSRTTSQRIQLQTEDMAVTSPLYKHIISTIKTNVTHKLPDSRKAFGS